MRALIVGLLLTACGPEDAPYMIVTVEKRPSVHDVTRLHVTLSNADSDRNDYLDLNGTMLPATFSLTAPGRSGELTISIDALGDGDRLVGRGTTGTPLTATEVKVLLDPADFVVNTMTDNSQFLSTDYEAVGTQLAGLSNGTWTTVFRDDCPGGMCNVFGRRFDPNGTPVTSELAGGTNQFPIPTTMPDTNTTPAVAATGLTTLALWDVTDSSVACRAINEQGAASANQMTVASDMQTDVVAATGLSNNMFVATWQAYVNPYYVVRGVFLNANCTAASAVTTINTGGALLASRAHVASNGANVLFGWIVNGEIRLRPYSLTSGAFTDLEHTRVAPVPGLNVDFVRIAPWGQGFAVAARWAHPTDTNMPGKIEVYRTNSSGVVMGTPILISDTSRSDLFSDKAFGIARRDDDALLVVWHECPMMAGSCNVFGRILRPTGTPVGPPFQIPTSTSGDQISPSAIALQDSFVVAWNDASGEEPDTSGTAVRARIVYPIYDEARGVMGALCGASAPGAPECKQGLGCASGSDGVQRCYALCESGDCPKGGTCTMDGSISACTY